jgi:hypothetical protein
VAAAFEQLTLAGGIKEVGAQVPDARPYLFRQARFLSAVDFVQADRFSRSVAQEMARIVSHVDLLLVPSLQGEMLTVANFTGHPSLSLSAPVLWKSPMLGATGGCLFDESVLGRAGLLWSVPQM